ncbi:MAG: RNA polymerase sigma factor [Acidimicrobiales bacterium]
MATIRTERFRAIYDGLFDDLTSYCRRRVPPDDVADLVAETMMIIWQRLDDVPTGAAARPWAYAVTRNLMRNHWRKGQRSDALRTVLIGELHQAQERNAKCGTGPALEPDQIEALVDALHGLKPKEQELIRLATWEELSHADIAVVLDCSTNAVAIRLLRARGHLADRLGRDPRWGNDTSRNGATVKTPKAIGPSRHVGGDGRTATENDTTTSDVTRPGGCK